MPVDLDLPFDPVRVRLKIFELRRNLHGLEALMETYGIQVDPPRTRSAQVEHAPEVAAHRQGATTRQLDLPPPLEADTSAAKHKLADLAYAVLVAHGGTAHGKKIVSALKAAGHMADVAHPDSNISTALSRDRRVERVPGVRNTWRVKTK